MLQVQHLRKYYGAVPIFSDISFQIQAGDKVGLIGPNGVGKSTLLRCLVGLETPDGGQIRFSPSHLRIGYLPQQSQLPDDSTLGSALASAQAAWHAAEQHLQQAAEQLSQADASALHQYAQALATFEALGGYQREQRAREVQQQLGLDQINPETLISQLSGGQKTRVGLAQLLLQEPDLLLLDEPTNHLDHQALHWLEGFVRSYPGSVMIVSHDRTFLDQTVQRVIWIDPDSRVARIYMGGYSDFAVAREHEQLLLFETWKKQQEYIRDVEADITQTKQQALKVELNTTPRQPQVRRIAKKVAKKAKSRERKLERYLESEERVEKPKQHWQLKLNFGQAPAGGQAVLRIEDLSFGYQQSLLFQHVTFEVGYAERIAIIGPNGAGKTTLLQLIAGNLTPTTGRIRLGAGVKLGLLSQEQHGLIEHWSVLEHIQHTRPMSDTEARNLLHFFLFSGESVFQRVAHCSFGERARLQLALLALQGCNLLLLDEPLNHLDIDSREQFEAALEQFTGTVLVVAHDRMFVSSFAERVIEVRDGSVYEQW